MHPFDNGSDKNPVAQVLAISMLAVGLRELGMKHSIGRVTATLIFLLGAICSGQAADVDNSPVVQVVAPGKQTRFLDLARQFVPDLDGIGNTFTGRKFNPVRHIGGRDFGNEDVETFGLFDVSHVMMKADGKDRLLVLFDFSQAASAAQGIAILALYDLSTEKPSMLDAADIGFDASTYFFDRALLPVSDKTDVILTLSSHFNSNQNYATQSMILVRNDRFELIDSTSLLGERTCGVDRQQVIRYAANPTEGKPYAPIKVTVTDTASAIEEVCADLEPAEIGVREIKATYVWNAGKDRYFPDSDSMELLEKDNQSRY